MSSHSVPASDDAEIASPAPLAEVAGTHSSPRVPRQDVSRSSMIMQKNTTHFECTVKWMHGVNRDARLGDMLKY